MTIPSPHSYRNYYDWLAPKLSSEERKALDVIYEAANRSNGPSGHVSTHWDGCGKEGGRRHYECLLHDYERLERELNAALQDLPTATKG